VLYNWLKLFAVGSIAMFMKRRWKGLLSVSILLSATWIAHSEYLAYKLAIEDPTFIGIAYTLKWVATITILMSYFFHLKYLSPTQSEESLPMGNIQLQGDGFDSIRQKKKLKSTAQQLIDSKPDDDTE
jgi:hypothetical protein